MSDSEKSRVTNGWFTSKTQEWETPRNLFEALDRIFEFTLDPCASDLNAKCERYYTKKEDGLTQKWFGNVFMNPPFAQLDRWFPKAINELQKNNCQLVISLTPSRSTESRYFQKYVLGFACEIWFLTPRIHYINPFQREKRGAVFGSMVCIFERKPRKLGYPIIKGVNWKRLIRKKMNHSLSNFMERAIKI